MSETIVLSMGNTSKTITVDDGTLQKIEDAFAHNYNRPETIEDEDGDPIPNPQTKMDVVFYQVRRFMVDHIRSHRKKVETAPVTAAVDFAVDTIDSNAVVS